MFIHAGLQSCESGPGEGGTSAMEGKIYVHDYNSNGILKGKYYGYNEKVYLSYGEDGAVRDETRTGFDGSFRFEFLRKGNYKLYAITKCDSCVADEVPITVDVRIDANRKVYILDDIVVRR